MSSDRRPGRRPLRTVATAASCLIAGAVALAACGGDPGPTPEDLKTVDYAPSAGVADWQTSTPEAQGLDPDRVAEVYWRAAKLESIHSLLVLKNGFLVAEQYYGAGTPELTETVQSVTKSYTGALVGIAIDDGCIPSVDEPMLTYFPELTSQIEDERKAQITIRDLLQMRAGYPWEEPRNVVDVPLVRDPGSGWDYSNLSSHLLGIIVSRACDSPDLLAFANEHLFDPLGTTPAFWQIGWEGYRSGHADLQLSARDLARFGQTYLDGGVYNGTQVVPAAWIDESWQRYTEDAWYFDVGPNWHSNYGYQWWVIDAGPHTYNLAWGHGGQQIAVLPEQDLVVVLTADPLWGEHGDGPWALETANLNLVADFIAGLPRP
jgi:CubicO group peptidase (beta-lactamase class C family)